MSAAATLARAVSSRSALRAARKMFAPSLASALAVARPMPTLPPVMTATLSRGPKSMISPPDYLTIGVFDRPIVKVTAIITTTPKTMVSGPELPGPDDRRGSLPQDCEKLTPIPQKTPPAEHNYATSITIFGWY